MKPNLKAQEGRRLIMINNMFPSFFFFFFIGGARGVQDDLENQLFWRF
jgi:hypothetical protein